MKLVEQLYDSRPYDSHYRKVEGDAMDVAVSTIVAGMTIVGRWVL